MTTFQAKCEIGFSFSVLTEAARFHERKSGFKIKVSDLVNQSTIEEILKGLELTSLSPDGAISDGAVLESIRQKMDEGEWPDGEKLEAGNIIDWCCRVTENGWEKCRFVSLLKNGSELTAQPAVTAYQSTTGTISHQTLEELRSMKILLTVKWVVPNITDANQSSEGLIEAQPATAPLKAREPRRVLSK